jgi:hypothetical protein
MAPSPLVNGDVMTSGSGLTAVFAGFIRLVMGVNLEQVGIA